MNARDLPQSIAYTVLVELRRQRLEPIPIRLQFRVAPGGISVEDIKSGTYTFFGPTGLEPAVSKPEDDLQTFKVELEVTPRWAANRDDLAQHLRLLVDLSAFLPGVDRFRAPVTLIAAPDAPPDLLSEVRFAPSEDKDQQRFIFTKQK
jgi:hypothetical protein